MEISAEIRRQMGQAAALSPQDAAWREVERKVRAQGGAALEEWRQLLEENERLRAELPSLPVPADLQRRLVELARPRRDRWLRRRWPWMAAVAGVVLVAAGVLLWSRSARQASRLQTVALLAINNHVNHLDDHHLAVETTDRKTLASALAGTVPFDVRVPGLGAEFQLLGGRKCALGSHPVAYSLWLDAEGKRCSLFQFRPEDFEVPLRRSPKLVHSQEPAGAKHPCPAVIWSDDRFGYVLVGESGAALRSLLPE